VDPAIFRAEVEKIRKQGWAMDDCEMDSDLRCLAVPVRDAGGNVVAAISSSGSPATMDKEKVEIVRAALLQAAARIGEKVYQDTGSSPFRSSRDDFATPCGGDLRFMGNFPPGLPAFRK